MGLCVGKGFQPKLSNLEEVFTTKNCPPDDGQAVSLMTPLPTPARLMKGANLLKGAVKIISPIVWGEGLVRMFVPSALREKWGWI